jgi:hypothetical protein
MKKTLYFLWVLLLAACQQVPVAEKAPPLPTDPAVIDRAVAVMPRPDNVKELISTLKARWISEPDRARATYAWVAHNIEYDTDAFFRGTATSTDAKGTFESGKSVCEGYSDLFTEIAKGLGLEVQSIKGWAKGYGYRQGTPFEGTNHAWNAVKVNGHWQLMDATWAAGAIEGRKFKRDYTAAWYDMDPQLFILHHLPEKSVSTLLDTSPSMSDYLHAPYLENWHLEQWHAAGFGVAEQRAFAAMSPLPARFEHYSASFHNNGGKTEQLIAWLQQGEVPAVWHYPDYPARILEVPADGRLMAGHTYRFAVEVAGAADAAVINGDEFTFLQRDGSTYHGTVAVKAGEVSLSAKIRNEGKEQFWPLLMWKAR